MDTKVKDKNTTVRISTELRNRLKIRATEKNTTQEKLLAEIVKGYFTTPQGTNNKPSK